MTDPEQRLTADDFDPEVLRLFDPYVHGALDRRGFLDGASRFAVGGVTAAGPLEALSPAAPRWRHISAGRAACP